jgi:hypothetical protein
MQLLWHGLTPETPPWKSQHCPMFLWSFVYYLLFVESFFFALFVIPFTNHISSAILDAVSKMKPAFYVLFGSLVFMLVDCYFDIGYLSDKESKFASEYQRDHERLFRAHRNFYMTLCALILFLAIYRLQKLYQSKAKLQLELDVQKYKED